MSFKIIYCLWYHNNIRLIVNNIFVERKAIDQLLLLLIPIECQRLSDMTKASVSKINASEINENLKTYKIEYTETYYLLNYAPTCIIHASIITHSVCYLHEYIYYSVCRFLMVLFSHSLREKKLTLWTRVCFLWIKSTKKKLCRKK